MKQTQITGEKLAAWADAYRSCKRRRLATLALSKTEINDVIFVRGAANAMRQKFSLEIPTMEVTNQMASGRCWLFAAANVLREKIAKDLNLEQLELSQSYLAFYDKFERANYFMESVLQTAHLPTDDRTVSFLLATGVHDGGQWDMFANIVEKYGIVPKDVYDETYQTSHTRGMNHYLNLNLKACAVKLRGMCARGDAPEAIASAKDAMLGDIYGFLASCYGEPPKTFDFEYVDKDKAYHIDKGLTPKGFYDKYVGDMLKTTVSIINAPTDDKPYGKTYTVEYLGNVVGGRAVKHLNLSMEDFKRAIIAQMRAGKVVWFGSDVGKFGERTAGVWDDNSYDAELLCGMDLSLTKAQSLDYGYSAMNHAMVLSGVNLDGDKPTRWKIENSWGDKSGEKGYYICSDTWFDQYVYQAAVEREYLGAQAALYDQAPATLAPWDPMGTLAE